MSMGLLAAACPNVQIAPGNTYGLQAPVGSVARPNRDWPRPGSSAIRILTTGGAIMYHSVQNMDVFQTLAS